MNHIEATQHIKATLAAFGPGEAISMTLDTWAKLHEAMSVLIEQPAQQKPLELETVYETIIQWDEGGGKRSRRKLARRIVALYTSPQPAHPGHTEAEVQKLLDLMPNKNDARVIRKILGVPAT